MDSNKTPYKERIAKTHAKRGNYEWYKPMYQLSEVLSYVVLAASVIFSLRWYESNWFASYDWSTAYAFLVSTFIAVVIGLMANHVAKIWFIEKHIDIFSLILLCGISWNAYTDFFGGGQLAEEFHQAPTDAKSAQIQKQIDQVDSDILAVWNKYRWKGELPKALTDAYKKYGHDVDGDKAKIAQLDQQRGAYVQALATHQAQFKTKNNKYEEKRIGSKSTMQGWSIGLTIFFLILTGWRAHFGNQVREEVETADVTKGNEEETPDVTGGTGGVTKPEIIAELLKGLSIDEVLDLYNSGK